MRETFLFFSDPAHGWLKVSKKELAELGIADKITGYSYMRGDNVFLEEDGDASLFQDKYEQKFNKKPKYDEQISNKLSKIRSYSSYKYEGGS